MAGHLRQPGWRRFRLLEPELLPQMGSDFEEASARPGWLSSDTERALAPEAERHHPLWVGRKIDGSFTRAKQEILGSRCAVGRMLVLCDRRRLSWAGPTPCGGCRIWLLGAMPGTPSERDQPSHSLKESGAAPVLSCGRTAMRGEVPAQRYRSVPQPGTAGTSLSASFPATPCRSQALPCGSAAAEGRLSRPPAPPRRSWECWETAQALEKETATERELRLLAPSF